MGRTKLSEEERDLIIAMVGKGMTPQAVAAKTGRSTRTVYRVAHGVGQATRRQGGVKSASKDRRDYMLGMSDAGDINARYRDLASAVVVLAVNDLREAVRREMRTGKGAAEVASLAHWFTTPWAQTLCGACGVDAPSVPAIVRRQEAERLAERLGA